MPQGPCSPFCTHASVLIEPARRGALAGLTFAAKDVFAVEGHRNCYGNPAWLDHHPPATRTAPAVAALLEAGAKLVGMTLTDELALSLTGENAHYGTPENPRCPSRVPGGSSSGSAVAVASGAVDFALGTDTGGSVRVPASHTGVLGFRPTHGAIPLDGVLPLAPSFDTVGWFARDAAMLERVGAALLPPSEVRGRPSALVLWPVLERFLDEASLPAFRDGAERLATALEAPLVRALPDADVGELLGAYLTLQNLQAAAIHRTFIERVRPRFGTLIAGRFESALATDADAARGAEVQRARWTAEAERTFDRGAWLVVPSAPGAAPVRGSANAAIDAFTGRGLSLASIASLGGFPQISVPIAESEGCPFGVSLLASRGRDLDLLSAACALPAKLVRPSGVPIP